MNHLKSYKLFETEQSEEAIRLFNAVGPMEIRNRWELYYNGKEVGKALIFINISNDLKIDGIDIHKAEQSNGYATVFMEQISKVGDENNMTLVLTPSDYKGSSKKRLEDFYKRFDFVMNKGRTKDYSISELMYRNPH